MALWGATALVVVALAAGGGSYLWFRSQVETANARVDQEIIEALRKTTSTLPHGSGSTSTTIDPPTGMNIVLLGSDKRASTGAGGRSDTIILVHVDSRRNFLSMLSIPRDLRVAIPGHAPNRINAAYRFGGPALVIRTIEGVFGVDLDHYMEIDFNAFKQITDTLGGVYVDVDRSYNDGQIVFDPGYQLLDGLNALRYVRTRHDANYDFGRMERQQRFLNAVREQAMGWNLPLKLPGLIKALFDNIDTDLGANEFLRLAYWGVKLDGSRMRQAKLVGNMQNIDGTSFVVATDDAIDKAVADFFTEPAVTKAQAAATPVADVNLKTADLSGVSLNVVNATGRVGQGALASVWLMRQGATVLSIKEADQPAKGAALVTYPKGKNAEAAGVAKALGIPMTRQSAKSSRIMVTLCESWGLSGDQIPAAATSTLSANGVIDGAEWAGLAGKVPFVLVAPTFLPANCTHSFQRSYTIAVGNKGDPAMRMGYQYAKKDRYMGFSATTWTEAPLASPGWRVKGPGGVVFQLVGSSTKTDHVWWVQNGVLYWISNTLVFDLRREEMLATAMSSLPVSPGPAPAMPAASATTPETSPAATAPTGYAEPSPAQ